MLGKKKLTDKEVEESIKAHNEMMRQTLRTLTSALCLAGHTKESLEASIAYNLDIIQKNFVSMAPKMERRDVIYTNLAFVFITASIKVIMNNPLYDDHALIDQINAQFDILLNKHSSTITLGD